MSSLLKLCVCCEILARLSVARYLLPARLITLSNRIPSPSRLTRVRKPLIVVLLLQVPALRETSLPAREVGRSVFSSDPHVLPPPVPSLASHGAGIDPVPRRHPCGGLPLLSPQHVHVRQRLDSTQEVSRQIVHPPHDLVLSPSPPLIDA